MKKYPLKFLDAYTKQDIDIFFGREEEINALYEMVFQTDILLLYGASGTGKTSLIQCGLASRFESHDWLDLYIRRGNNINESLSNTLQKAAGTVAEDVEWEEIDLEEEEDDDTKKGELTALEQQLQNIYLTAFRPLYLIFDQFEELYILGSEEEQQEFVQSVKRILALNQPVKMIFSIREEYLGDLYDFERDVPQLLKKKLRVEPMTLTKIQEVIGGITSNEDANISIKEGELVAFTEGVFKKLQGVEDKEEMEKDAATLKSKAKRLTVELPYLQVFLDQIYLEATNDNSRQTTAEFSLSNLAAIGKIDDVLRDFLEEQVILISQRLQEKHEGINPEVIWQVLSPFVTLEGTKDPITIATVDSKVKNTLDLQSDTLLPLTTDLIDAFQKSKIIRYLETEEAYEVAHDALALKIAEKRTDEEIALLEVKRLIKSQAIINQKTKETFTEKQLNFITPYLEKLDLDSNALALIAESRQKIADAKAAAALEQERRFYEAQAQAETEKHLREEAEVAYQKALTASERAIKRTRLAIGIAFIAALSAGVAIFSFFEARKSEAKANDALKEVKTQKENALKAQRMAEVSDSLAQIDKNKAIKSDSVAQIKAKEAKASEQKATQALTVSKQQTKLAQQAQKDLEKSLTKNGQVLLDNSKRFLNEFQFEEAQKALQEATNSKDKAVQDIAKIQTVELILINLYKSPPQQWATTVKPFIQSIKRANKGIILDYSNPSVPSVLMNAFEKAYSKALRGNKIEARREIIVAMEKVLGRKMMNLILKKYNYF